MYQFKLYGIKRKTIYLQQFFHGHEAFCIEPTSLIIEKSVGPMRIGYFIQV